MIIGPLFKLKKNFNKEMVADWREQVMFAIILFNSPIELCTFGFKGNKSKYQGSSWLC